jgi:hypothetical protein
MFMLTGANKNSLSAINLFFLQGATRRDNWTLQ